MNKHHLDLIADQFADLKIKYPGLNFILKENVPLVHGPLDFRAKYNSETITGVFNIEITFPEDYPATPPTAREIGGCIPSDFHKNENDILCLTAPVILKMQFSQSPTLIFFVDNIVVPYLYSFRYWEKNGKMPFGEYAHGFEGIIQSYQDLLNSTSDIVVLKLLRILAEGNYRGHIPCPCDSGKKLRNCHGPILIETSTGADTESFLHDFLGYLFLVHESGTEIPHGLISKRIDKSVRKMFKKLKE